MRLGLIARADARGLGIQTKSFHDAMRPAKTMVVDCPSANPLPLRHDWYPDATWVHGLPTYADFERWLDGLDVVYTAETAYGPLWDAAERRGVKTVLHCNREFLDLRDRPTLWAAPSMWHWGDIPAPKTFLPVPIETDKFGKPADSVGSGTRQFLHIVGRPAVFDRNGSLDLLHSLALVKSEVVVSVRCQDPTYVEGLIHQHGIRTPNNVTLRLEAGDIADNAELYAGQDVLILPRRYGGLSLPVNEALGCGMPVIMPNISPNNTWLPAEWLVPAHWTNDFMAKTRVDVYATNAEQLAAQIDRFTDEGFFQKAQTKARELADGLSWTALKPLYNQIFEQL